MFYRFMQSSIATCVICSKPVTAETAAVDAHGFVAHHNCYSLIARVKRIRNSTPDAVRCPYCVEGHDFKLMKPRADGEWFLCTACGHANMPSHPSYRCNCPKCEALA
jgi:hypothetical protein